MCSLDPGERVGAKPREHRGNEREVDIGRRDHGVGPVAAVEVVAPHPADERVIARPTSKCVVASKTQQRVISSIAEDGVGKRRPDDVLDARVTRQR